MRTTQRRRDARAELGWPAAGSPYASVWSCHHPGMEPYEAIWHMRPIRRGLRLHRDDEPVSRTDLFLVCRWCLPIVRDRIDARAADLPGHIARWAPPLIPLTGERRALVRRRYAAMLRPGVPGPPLEA